QNIQKQLFACVDALLSMRSFDLIALPPSMNEQITIPCQLPDCRPQPLLLAYYHYLLLLLQKGLNSNMNALACTPSVCMKDQSMANRCQQVVAAAAPATIVLIKSAH